MKKLTKISAFALFSLFLTACDKPADSAAQSPKAEATATAQVSDENSEQGAADFKKIVEWNQAQEQALGAVQVALQQKMATGDSAQIEQALKEFSSKVAETITSLDAVEIKDRAVVAFKEQIKRTLMLSNQLVADAVAVMANQTVESQKEIQDKSQILIQSGQELQKMQLELQQKFMPAPTAK